MYLRTPNEMKCLFTCPVYINPAMASSLTPLLISSPRVNCILSLIEVRTSSSHFHLSTHLVSVNYRTDPSITRTRVIDIKYRICKCSRYNLIGAFDNICQGIV